MKNILIINGAEFIPEVKGLLNKTLFDQANLALEGSYNIKTTYIAGGYDSKEEQEKFAWADIILLQTPIYWYDAPSHVKKYIEDVYAFGVFFMPNGEKYGTFGLLKGKQYMVSATFTAPLSSFNDEAEFFEGKSEDDVLVGLHKTNQYVGMKQLKSFYVHFNYGQVNIEEYTNAYQKHLEEVFQIGKN